MIKCENCEKEVIPQKKKFNTLLFLFFIISIVFIPFAIIQLIIHLCKRKDYCPNCNKSVYKKTINTMMNNKLMESGNPLFLYITKGIIIFIILILFIALIIDYI